MDINFHLLNDMQITVCTDVIRQKGALKLSRLIIYDIHNETLTAKNDDNRDSVNSNLSDTFNAVFNLEK